MIRLETDPDLVNRIANQPSVRPFIRPDGGEMDWAPALAHRPSVTGIVVLSNGEDAVAVFEATAIGAGQQVFRMDTMFAATCRGRRAIDTGKEMLAWMFAHGATIIWGATPRVNRAARWFNRQIGGYSTGGDELVETFEMRAT